MFEQLSNQLTKFVPIMKVDVAKREVWGRMAAEEEDKSKEIFDYETSKGHFQEWSDGFQKTTGGKSLGNVRVMHQPIAAGKVIALAFDDVAKTVDVGTKIVDDDAWAKCEAGVFTGFSMGGSYVKKWADGDLVRYTAKPAEVSLVDNPCIPSALFTVVKADGSEELRKFASSGDEPSPQPEPEPEPSPAPAPETEPTPSTSTPEPAPTEGAEKLAGVGAGGLEKDTVVIQAGAPVVQEAAAVDPAMVETQAYMSYTLDDVWYMVADVQYMVSCMYESYCMSAGADVAQYAVRPTMTKALEAMKKAGIVPPSFAKATKSDEPDADPKQDASTEKAEKAGELTKAEGAPINADGAASEQTGDLNKLVQSQLEELRKATDQIGELKARLEKLEHEPVGGGPVLTATAAAQLAKASVAERGFNSDGGEGGATKLQTLQTLAKQASNATLRSEIEKEILVEEIRIAQSQ